MLIAISMLTGLISTACAILLLIPAFKSAIWKGLVSLLCGLYLIYFTVTENQDKYKWLLLLGWLGVGFVSYAMAMMSGIGKAPVTPGM